MILVERQFVCPECGSREFGTSCIGVSESKDQDQFFHDRAIGSYHGTIDGKPCGFTWPRSEDKKYWREV